MPSPASPPFKVGVIGYGLSAKIFHIPFILDLPDKFTLHAIVQRTPKPNDDASADHPTAKIYRSADDLIADPAVQLVIITTAPDSHYSLAKQSMLAGKHVLVEKPFVPTSAEAHDLVSIAQKSSVFLTVYQNRRYDTDFLTLKSVLPSLGRIASFASHFDRHRPDPPTAQSWKTDPTVYSAVYDLGTHLMDQVVSLYGLPAKITGFVGSQRSASSSLEDSFTIHMHYPSALTATCTASVVSATPAQPRYWMRGTSGTFQKSHLDPQEDQLKAGLRPGQDGYGLEPAENHGTLTRVVDGGKFVQEVVEPVENRGYSAFYAALARALETGDAKELPVDPEVAAEVIRLCELVRRSSQEGRTLDV